MKIRKPYADEFRQEAIKLVTEHGMTIARVARDLDVSVDTLRRWLRAAQPSIRPVVTPPAPSAELAHLRRENEQLRMERDILKKALGIFSRMPQ